jgi:hypothetical protein
MSTHTGIRVAEIGYLLILIAGVWQVATVLLHDRFDKIRSIVAGLALAAAGLLLIIATHWGHYG